MLLTNLTPHAKARMQQRGIAPCILEHLLDFGVESHDHRGARIVFFDHRARARLSRHVGPEAFRQLEPNLDTYAVLGEDGEVITVGHRTRHINRH